MLKPSDFKDTLPEIIDEGTVSFIAWMIICHLTRNGDTWRTMTQDEFRDEQQRCGEYCPVQLEYFNQAVYYTTSPEMASSLCPDWKVIFDADAEATFGGQ